VKDHALTFSENTAEIHLGGRILLDRTEDE